MRNFRKHLMSQVNAANVRAWEHGKALYPQKLLQEEWNLTGDGQPRLEAQFEGYDPQVWQPKEDYK